MPKGKHKGGKRHFTNFEATEEERLKKEKEKQWRKTRGESDSEDEDGSDKSDKSESEEESSEESEEEEREVKAKGVSGLIQTQNLNRQVQKTKKVTDLDLNASSKPELSRKEREEVQKQKAAAHYRKLHAAGKTEEARADLERLAIIRQQREEAAKKKEEERKAKEAAANSKKEQVAKALNKKSKS